MSWAAHDLEPYLIRAKVGAAISLPFCLLGSYAPDIATKWFVYGTGIRASNPTQFHRGWPGAGPTHSFAFGILVGLVIYALTRSRLMAGSFVIGEFSHVVTDMLDTVGVMAWFPFSTHHVALGAYAYAGELGRLPDAHAYYTSLGGGVDLLCVVLIVLNRRILTTAYVDQDVLRTDPAFVWIYARLGSTGARTFYYASVFFGIASTLGWLAWAVVWHGWGLDWSWGAPHWVPPMHLP